SRRKPPGALRSKVLWSASSWPSCVAASRGFSLIVPFAGAGLRASGRTVISRRRFLTGVALALAPTGAAATAQEYKAQQAGKVYRIGYLLAGRPPAQDLLKAIVPKVRHVAVRSIPGSPLHALAIGEVKGAARSLGVELRILEVRSPTEFDGAFAAMAKERAGALLISGDILLYTHRVRLA